MTFIWPNLLFSLLLIPLLVMLYFRLRSRRQQALAALGPMGIVQNKAGQNLGKRRHIPPLLFLLGLTLLLLGLARPETFVNLPHVEGTVILAFDVSNSMGADDLEPTRIDAAKAAGRAFVENQPSTILIGVVAFSSGGVVIQPPTNDQATTLASIERLTPQGGGTSLGQGIFTSLSAITGEPIEIDDASGEGDLSLEDGPALEGETPVYDIGSYPSAVIVLLSDGEDTEGSQPLEVAQVAAEAGVRIYPVGIGSTEGAVLEVDGFNILTQLNETALKEIANVTNGVYYHAEDEESLQEIYENIDLQLTIAGDKMEITSLLAAAGFLFFLSGGALSLLWFGRVP